MIQEARVRYTLPPLCILHYKIVPQNMVYHFFWPLVSETYIVLGQS